MHLIISMNVSQDLIRDKCSTWRGLCERYDFKYYHIFINTIQAQQSVKQIVQEYDIVTSSQASKGFLQEQGY